ncbi:hypothetical protein L873DRAFT_511559 [Choiromyces venosus 120613-1]|uniref:Uncharacterized protein n=1 Tax=Choiromyces venosus 120613-1 TaxID=1336337 RepID=A0A3N4IV00_9PEZI|nr:hypothetical protein L873DRAFT_511559 [Choiromyces venosus 120613-1]
MMVVPAPRGPEKPTARSQDSHASSGMPHTRLIRRRSTFSPEVFPSVRLVAAWCTRYCILWGGLWREFLMRPKIVERVDLVVVQSSLSVYPLVAIPGPAKEGLLTVSFIPSGQGGVVGGRNDRARKPAKELWWTEELEEVWGLVGGGNNEKAEAEAKSSEDGRPAETIDVKAGH